MPTTKKDKCLARLKAHHHIITSTYEFAKVSPAQAELEVRVADLASIRETFLEDYVELSSEEDQKELEEYFTSFNKMYYKLKAYVKPTEDRKCETTAAPNASLPPLKIPIFEGNVEDFPSFLSLFNTVVGLDNRLSDTQRLYYLHSVLRGEPQHLIRHLAIDESNFNVAMELLKKRYDNKRLLIDRNLRAILQLSVKPHNVREFANRIIEHTEALRSLGMLNDQASYILLHILVSKLDLELRNRYEQTVAGFTDRLPALSDFITFLEIQSRINSELHFASTHTYKRAVCNITTSSSNYVSSACEFCKKGHIIYTCDEFKRMDVHNRREFVKKGRLCYRCLKPHMVANCTTVQKCKICGQNSHHTLLHTDKSSQIGVKKNFEKHSTEVLLTQSERIQSCTLLGTIKLSVRRGDGEYLYCRAVLDSGAQVSLITERCANALGLPRQNSSIVLSALGGNTNVPNKGMVQLFMKSRTSQNVSIDAQALVVPRITGNIPNSRVSSEIFRHIESAQLADPEFNVPGKIDILLGCSEFANIVNGSTLKFGKDFPVGIPTTFGVVLMGNSPQCANNISKDILLLRADSDPLERFFELEDIPVPYNNTINCNRECDDFFDRTTSRFDDGKFCVALPFKENAPVLGNSKPMALRRFFNLEKRFGNDAALKEKYLEFMREYIQLGHMSEYIGVLPPEHKFYFTPHHGVFKSGGSKIRVVFDASAKTNNGICLNDCLHSGTKLQNDISDVLIRFRIHKYVFSADIVKMFRNVWVRTEDRFFQLIFWRENPENPLRIYQLNTVTYGQCCSPYLSLKCLRQLAGENSQQIPEASSTIINDFYVDDLLTGANSLDECIKLKNNIVGILQSAGLQLGKWISNSPELLKDIPDDNLGAPRVLELTDSSYTKLLGVQWNHIDDTFTYRVELNKSECNTKRKILSVISGFFDPVGFIAPVIFKAKLIVQQLWLANIGWDERAPEAIQSEWQVFIRDIEALGKIRIPRWIVLGGQDPLEMKYTLHGFSDASKAGFSSCVYLRAQGSDETVSVRLLAAKTRVAPVRTPLTIPRLELCGTVLLAKLIEHVWKSIKDVINIGSVFAWSDSTIALSWLNMSPQLLQTYEGNRVSKVRETACNIQWRYVNTKLNPADIASRGTLAPELIGNQEWWNPRILQMKSSEWPQTNLINSDLPGIKKVLLNVETPVFDLIGQFSSFSKLQNVMAWCLRFIKNCRRDKPVNKWLTVLEVDNALYTCIRLVQNSELSEIISDVKDNKILSKQFRYLSPFIDTQGILRVGGRLKNSNLKYDARHPILLPKKSHFTELLIDYFHKLHCHSGPRALQAILQRKYWIVGARQAIRSRVHKCIPCFKLRAPVQTPMMADLPEDRVRQARAFDGVGVDFGGPFTMRASNLRNAKKMKAYLCVFVCLSTKAVHLEVVSELSTQAFLLTFQRFSSRRGIPSLVRSDCGTNFVGAARYLTDMHRHLKDADAQGDIQREVGKSGVRWLFNPPSAPNFGGIFEAAIKSAKQHLRRTIGDQTLTFEELSTVFTRIEAVLNSRPLCPLSDSPNELEVLTPGHFVIGQPLVDTPEVEHNSNIRPLGVRFKMLQNMFQHFWNRWHKEYLHTLQQRPKWNRHTDPIRVGELVLLKDDNIAPMKWRTARVSKLLPGSDGVVRVAEVYLGGSSSLLRPVSKLCRFPVS